MKIISLVITAITASTCLADSKPIHYTVGSTKYVGYLSFDSKIKGKRPGIIVAPEWWGVSAHEKEVADKLAALGYTALVLDLYGDGKSDFNPDQANALMQTAQKDPKQLNDIFDKGLALIKKEASADPTKLAAIGYGFGGGLVIDQARLSKSLKLAINFYGGLTNKDGRVPKKPIKAEILVIVGEHDQYVDSEQIAAFKEELGFLKVRPQVVIIKNAFQSFANKPAGASGVKYQMPFKYDANADKQAWDEVTKNLKRVFAR